MKYVFYTMIFVALIGGGIWWKTYAYHDCKHVGHSTLYCIVRIGD
jgi:hypothetical protein